MFSKILIANRGEIACRVIKTARRLGIATVAVHSDADRDALHVRLADEAVAIGPAPAAESYLRIERILDAIAQTGAEAVHPGYGFLSENPRFAAALAEAGVAFIGPPAGAIEAMGDKITSKKLAAEAGVSTVPGYMGLIETADDAVRIAGEIGYPVMIKASAGGGGKGMRIAWSAEETRDGYQSSKNEAKASFGDDRIFIEKFVTQPRHIEIQVLADTHGSCLYLGERECSIQRRNQKVIEEAPSPFLDGETRRAMGEQACALARAVGYASAGTVEFIVDGARNFYFLEMNTRLQVEHPVTELITGIDLVEQMIRVAAGERLDFGQDDVRLDGWAIESRLYAEDPYRNFLPSTGRLTRYRPPAEARDSERVVRNDTGVYEGGEISRFYDPMIAKLCTWAPDRGRAIEAMRTALDAFEVDGIGHNLPFLSTVMDHPRFVSGEITTAFIAEEFPEGFSGASLPAEILGRVAAVAGAMMAEHAARAREITGGLRPPAPRHRWEWTVSIGDAAWQVTAGASPVRLEPGYNLRDGRDYECTVVAADGTRTELQFELFWDPGERLAMAKPVRYYGHEDLADYETRAATMPDMALKLEERTEGFRIRYRGADLDVAVRAPRIAELARLMPVKLPPDTSKMLLCPMPGIVVSIAVGVGEEVQEGQALATVEAMKMENILRAERKAVVKSVNAAPGQSLAVDEIIMEFE
ncbi:MAG: acetyl-CoA carboxylase biotin carboxylase subunit [Paracoccaceae bacterium]